MQHCHCYYLFTIVVVIFANFGASLGHPSPTDSDDPCAGTTCGIGAQCEKVTNIIVCVCPDDSVGDPFVECKGSGVTSSSTTTVGVTATEKLPEHSTYPTTQQYIPTAPPQTQTTTIFSTTTTPTTERQRIASANSPDLNFQARPEHREILPEVSLSTVPVKLQPPLAPNTQADDDAILLSHIASAPPTLSHFAHSHTREPHPVKVESSHVQVPTIDSNNDAHSASAPSYYQQLTQLFSGPGSRTRTRPQQSPPQPPLQERDHDDHDHHSHRYNHNSHFHQGNHRDHGHGHGHGHGQEQEHVPTHFDLRQQYRPNPSMNLNPFQVTGPSHDSGLGHGFSSIAFGDVDQSNSYFKDPLGKYEDCRTVNNVIVCADNSDDTKSDRSSSSGRPSERHQYPLYQDSIQLFKKDIVRTPIPNFRAKPVPVRVPVPPLYQDSSLEIGSEPVFHSHRLDGPYGHPPPFRPESETREDLFGPSQPPNQNLNQNPAGNYNKKPLMPQPGSPESRLCEKFCGEEAVCRVLMGRPICGCPEGHTGDPSVRCVPILNSKFDKNSCQRHIDCSPSLVCLESQCLDPCANGNNSAKMCGMNAKCTVVHHTPLCMCSEGYDGNPYVGCVI